MEYNHSNHLTIHWICVDTCVCENDILWWCLSTSLLSVHTDLASHDPVETFKRPALFCLLHMLQPPIHLSTHLSISLHLSIYLSIYRSVCLCSFVYKVVIISLWPFRWSLMERERKRERKRAMYATTYSVMPHVCQLLNAKTHVSIY